MDDDGNDNSHRRYRRRCLYYNYAISSLCNYCSNMSQKNKLHKSVGKSNSLFAYVKACLNVFLTILQASPQYHRRMIRRIGRETRGNIEYQPPIKNRRRSEPLKRGHVEVENDTTDIRTCKCEYLLSTEKLVTANRILSVIHPHESYTLLKCIL